MLDLRSDVLAIVQGILGEMDTAQTSLLLEIISAVCIHMDGQLREGLSSRDCYSTYITAGAFYSISYFRSLDPQQLQSFTAGTVSLSFHQSPTELTRMADTLMAPWVKIPVIFRGVEG